MSLPILTPQPKQLQFINSQEFLCFYGGGVGAGKVGIATDKIYTPSGHTTYGTVKAGDTILNPDGSLQKVLKVFPHKDWEFYKITFTDGVSVEVGLEHLWVSYKGDSNQLQLVTTLELMDWLKDGYTPYIPVTNPVKFNEVSIKDRVDFLNRLIDESDRYDGYIICRGRYNKEYIRDSVESLGGLVTELFDGELRIDIPKIINQDANLRRSITSIEFSRIADGACISVSNPNHLYLTNNFVVTHNTYAVLLDNLQYMHDPHSYSVFFRNTTTELETNLWPSAINLYKPYLEHQSGPLKGRYKGASRIRDKHKEIIFPVGAKSKFAYLELDKHADAWYGAEISRCYFDEFQRTSAYAFHILRSRMRSKASYPSVMRATFNPDPNHFVYDWVKPFLDDEGFPMPEMSGVRRYFLIISGELHTSWDYFELKKKFPEKEPQTYTYISSTLMDNKILLELEPGYKDTLDQLPEVKRKQLLLGCWASSEDSGMLFQRKWLPKISRHDLPKDLTLVRAYDLASEEPTDNSKFPDYTYGLLMGKSKSTGYYYILGGDRMRKRPGARNAHIIDVLKKDQKVWGCVTCVTAVDPGAGGKTAFEEFNKQMVENGIKCKKDVIPTNKGKRIKYEPFSDAAENGLVYICEELFEKDELELLYRENETFDGISRSTSHRKDD